MHTIEQELRSNGLKATASRIAILQIVENAPHPISADQIYQQSLSETPLSLATIYRTLDTLTTAQLLLRERDFDGVLIYQRNHPHHSHRLVCTQCRKTVDLEGCPIEPAINELAAQTGFTITGHTIEIYGICSDCQKRENPAHP